MSDSNEVEGAGAYDLYFGITSRYLIYGFSGMGLRWIPSSYVSLFFFNNSIFYFLLFLFFIVECSFRFYIIILLNYFDCY